MSKLYILGLISLAGSVAGAASAEEITISTYYPAPYGVYRDFQAAKNLTVGEEGTIENPIISTTTLYGNVVIRPQNQDASSGLDGGELEVTGAPVKATGGLIIETTSTDPATPVDGRIWLIVP